MSTAEKMFEVKQKLFTAEKMSEVKIKLFTSSLEDVGGKAKTFYS